MLKSQFAVLNANLFIIGGFLSIWGVNRLVMLFLASLWFLSAVFSLYREKLEAIRLKQEIEYFNKIMLEGSKNGRSNRRK